MYIKSYKDGKILLLLILRKKYGINDHSELIITECDDGIKISTRQLLLYKLRQEFAHDDLNQELNNFRDQEFAMENK